MVNLYLERRFLYFLLSTDGNQPRLGGLGRHNLYLHKNNKLKFENKTHIALGSVRLFTVLKEGYIWNIIIHFFSDHGSQKLKVLLV